MAYRPFLTSHPFLPTTTTDPRRYLQMHISNIPTEIIEYILVYTAMAGVPQTVASFAQTCRFFRNLVYDPVDQHLWREVFLIEFDDPRLSPTKCRCKFDWGNEFRRRFKVANLLRSCATALSLLEVIDALSCVISTSLPFNPHGMSDASASSTNYRDDASPQSSYPIFPPTDRFVHQVDPRGRSKNALWLNKVLAHGYPTDIATQCMFGGAGTLCNNDRRRFLKLLCHTGLSPDSSRNGRIRGADSEALAILRHWARKKVYDMRYLIRDRRWGPYMLVHSRAPVLRRQDSDEEHMGTKDGEPFISSQNTFGSDEACDSQRVPLPGQLCVDWEYMFCVRMVMENNLRDTVGCKADELLQGLLGFDCLRSYSAPGTTGRKSHPLMSSTEAGWDWAGIEGVWRRCVCWMDYRDLILSNIGPALTRLPDSGVLEAIRIIPTRLRIVSYSAAPAEWPDRPTIHVEGEQGGPLGTSGIRKVHGTVCMTADGEVRHTMYTRRPGENDCEWVSEGIQIGRLGSAIGVMGMWTGAKHQMSDPLGPFWAWRVI